MLHDYIHTQDCHTQGIDSKSSKQAARLYSNGEIDLMTKPLRIFFLTTFFEMNLSYFSHLFKCQVPLNRFI
jgi:hypothetical protein